MRDDCDTDVESIECLQCRGHQSFIGYSIFDLARHITNSNYPISTISGGTVWMSTARACLLQQSRLVESPDNKRAVSQLLSERRYIPRNALMKRWHSLSEEQARAMKRAHIDTTLRWYACLLKATSVRDTFVSEKVQLVHH